jgi:hypothetical protein
MGTRPLEHSTEYRNPFQNTTKVLLVFSIYLDSLWNRSAERSVETPRILQRERQAPFIPSTLPPIAVSSKMAFVALGSPFSRGRSTPDFIIQ